MCSVSEANTSRCSTVRSAEGLDGRRARPQPPDARSQVLVDDHKDPAVSGGTQPPGKRKRYTRWTIPGEALSVLETASAKDQFSSIETRKALAADLKVKPQQVQAWFQNKRQREKTPGELMPPKQSENPNGGSRQSSAGGHMPGCRRPAERASGRACHCRGGM